MHWSTLFIMLIVVILFHNELYELWLLIASLYDTKQSDRKFPIKGGRWKFPAISGSSESRPIWKPVPMPDTGDVIKNLKDHPRSKSEAAVIKQLENITGHKFPTVNPSWLVDTSDNKGKPRTLELDGYCRDLAIALEFSGPLHTKWNSRNETYEKYFRRVKHDVIKKKVCADHGVNLIVIDMSLPSRHWNSYLKSRLYDIGFLDEKPTNYILEQVATPYRNETLEKELNLEI